MRVLFFPGSLETGGAQAQAVLLARGLAARGHRVRLLTLFPGGKFWEQLSAEGELLPEALFPSMGSGDRSRGRWATLRALAAAPAALRRRVAKAPPSVVLSSLYVSNFLAARAWPAGSPPLVWSVRGSDVPWSDFRRLYFEAGRRLAGRPRAVIYNSFTGREWHLRRGFPEEGGEVIVNGIDTEVFAPERSRGESLRQRWGAREGELLVGIAGRLSPMKDHGTFLEAAARVARRVPSARFVCIGGGPEKVGARLQERAQELGLEERLTWAGEVREMADAYNALDVLASSSAYGEGFSNVLAEAMACGLSVVATASGDASRVLGEAGRLVPQRQPELLAGALVEALEEGPAARQNRGRAARRRVVESFSVETMVEATEALLERVAGETSGTRAGGREG